MKFVKDLRIPEELQAVLNTSELQDLVVNELSSKFSFLEFPMEFLQSLEEIRLLSSDQTFLIEEYWNVRSSQNLNKEIDLPYLDFDNSLMIAINKYPGEDLAIALDYRSNPDVPCVVGSNFNKEDGGCEWKTLSLIHI